MKVLYKRHHREILILRVGLGLTEVRCPLRRELDLSPNKSKLIHTHFNGVMVLLKTITTKSNSLYKGSNNKIKT